MILRIKDIGKIQDSTIEIKGITVIAGENSTGKSTFGKVLYCMFNAFYNKETMIRNVKINYISHIIGRLRLSIRTRSKEVKKLSEKIIAEIENKNLKEFSEEYIKKILLDLLPSINKDEDEIINDIIKDIRNSILITDEEIQKIIISNHLENEFEEQINHVNKSQSQGEISLTIKGNNINISIKNNGCSKFDDNVNILYNAMYIDTPFVMDNVEEYPYTDSYKMNHREYLSCQLGKKQSDDTLIEKAIVNQKIENVLANINSIVNGEFEEDEEGLKFKEKNLVKTISLFNVSAGIKVFLIIKRLLELGKIKERGVLILDEPEIHLHPEWQLKFAEILIILQKEFNLTVLLNTHSPYFLNAIEVYGKKHGIKDQINFYLAKKQEDTSCIQDVTNNIDDIYKQLAMPFQKLEEMKYGN